MSRQRQGILLMITAAAIFAMQDGISRYLGASYSPIFVVAVRYWLILAALILYFGAQGRLRAVIATRQPLLQLARGVILAAETCISVYAFVLLGLGATHAIMASFPLLVALLSWPILSERLSRAHWAAIGAGFIGILILLRPGVAPFSPYAGLAVLAAVLFGLYHVLTRLAAREDGAATSFAWTGLGGAALMTLIGPGFASAVAPGDWLWLIGFAALSLVGHLALVGSLTLAEAGTVQPFTYLQLVFVTAIGVVIFGEPLELWAVIGSAVVVAAGLAAMRLSR